MVKKIFTLLIMSLVLGSSLTVCAAETDYPFGTGKLSLPDGPLQVGTQITLTGLEEDLYYESGHVSVWFDEFPVGVYEKSLTDSSDTNYVIAESSTDDIFATRLGDLPVINDTVVYTVKNPNVDVLIAFDVFVTAGEGGGVYYYKIDSQGNIIRTLEDALYE